MPSDRGLPPPGSWLFLETYNGASSLAPEWASLQATAYSSLQLPGLLVGDSRPGGLGRTIKAHVDLRTHGHDIQGAFVFKDANGNYAKVSEYFEQHNIPYAAFRQVPEKLEEDPRKSKNIMTDYYAGMARTNMMKDLMKRLHERHKERITARQEGQLTPQEEEVAALALASAPKSFQSAQFRNTKWHAQIIKNSAVRAQEQKLAERPERAWSTWAPEHAGREAQQRAKPAQVVRTSRTGMPTDRKDQAPPHWSQRGRRPTSTNRTGAVDPGVRLEGRSREPIWGGGREPSSSFQPDSRAKPARFLGHREVPKKAPTSFGGMIKNVITGLRGNSKSREGSGPSSF